jgi:hypothetical protein
MADGLFGRGVERKLGSRAGGDDIPAAASFASLSHQEKPPKLISDNFGKKNKRNLNPIISIK